MNVLSSADPGEIAAGLYGSSAMAGLARLSAKHNSADDVHVPELRSEYCAVLFRRVCPGGVQGCRCVPFRILSTLFFGPCRASPTRFSSWPATAATVARLAASWPVRNMSAV